MAAGRLDGEEALVVAVTRWKPVLAGGTPLPRVEGFARLGAAGFREVAELPVPPTAPARYAARRA